MDKEKLASLISQARANSGLTRAEFSEKSGISTNYLYDIEKARGRTPSRDMLFRLAKALELDPREVFKAAGVEFPLKEKPEKFIPIPYDFPPEAQRQLETFAKFLQYQDEFEQFLKAYQSYQEGQPDWDTFKKDVRGEFEGKEKNVS